ncbi:DUF4142 domain-containing protein [Caulobacter sp. 17J65-9]|uniref:DUF4142 domain-containing protein n=1 Tax=Caulobacter sp. 17J65-9 TaxID=2709382 RepID=UPI0013C5783A|nr:DUF4142 domain-containing protein [Caulobacter sp. 17J65-9]NEX92827.1 DUF4142 domain-containing protein [Caulobacter sp. 17J65-9]
MIRNPFALSGAIALTLLAAAACGRKEEATPPAEPATPAATEPVAPVAPAPAVAATPTTAAEFVPMVASANLFELESSKLAEKMGQTAAVKDVAKVIVVDHTKLATELAAAVKKAGLTVTMPTALEGEAATEVADLRAAPAADFDAKYLADQRTAHEKAIAAFQTYADTGDNADIKAFAAAALPRLRAHLEAVNKALAAPAAAPAAAAAPAPAKK